MTTKRWQRIGTAKEQADCSRQAIYDAISRGEIESRQEYGFMLVPDPLRWRPSKLRQRRAGKRK